jgi:hypothetical protein
MYVPFLKKSLSISHQFFCLTVFHLIGNIIRAFQSLGHHSLASELDMEVLTEVLEHLIEVAMPKPNAEHVHNFNIDSPIKKRLRRLLDYE